MGSVCLAKEPIAAIGVVLGLLLVAIGATPADAAKHARATASGPLLTADAIENVQWSENSRNSKLSPVVFKAEVLLDRAGFSPGEIDASDGENFQKAVRAYQQANKLSVSGKLDRPTWDSLVHSTDQPVTSTYTVSASDEEGPFVQHIPQQFDEMSKLKRLGYRSPEQLLAEKFHMSEAVLSTLNKGVDFGREGTRIIVAGVDPMPLAGSLAKEDSRYGAGNPKAARVEVDKGGRAVRVFARDGELLAFYPASIGSAEKPAPSGNFAIKSVSLNPTYHYDPRYAFKGQKTQQAVTVAPGPKNPVGLVWIDLSAKSYGIHGTPTPANVSKTESHGCIRLTNWDALALAKLVKRGLPVEFVE